MLVPVSASVMYCEKFSMLVSQWFSSVFFFFPFFEMVYSGGVESVKCAYARQARKIYASIRRAPLCYDDFVKNSKGRSKSVRFVLLFFFSFSLCLSLSPAASYLVQCFVHAALVWVNKKERSGTKRVKHSSEWVNECWCVRFLWLLYFSLISCPFSILHLSKWWW